VFIVRATKPCEASRCPIHAIDDCVAVKPGQIAMVAYEPAVVG
jgi:hypothetical protein